MMIKAFDERDRERAIADLWSRRYAAAEPEAFKSYLRRLKHKPKHDDE